MEKMIDVMLQVYRDNSQEDIYVWIKALVGFLCDFSSFSLYVSHVHFEGLF